jgi:hypothetical protein
MYIVLGIICLGDDLKFTRGCIQTARKYAALYKRLVTSMDFVSA